MSAQPIYYSRRVRGRRSLTKVKRRTVSRAELKRAREVRRAKALRARFISLCVLYAAVSLITFGALTLIGQSKKEQARHQAVVSNLRARAAINEVARIRTRVEKLVSLKIVDEWSKTKGYVAAYDAQISKVKPALSAKNVAIAKKSDQVAMLEVCVTHDVSR